MQINGTPHANAQIYLTHLFGQGHDDQRYVVERCQAATVTPPRRSPTRAMTWRR